MTASIKNFKRIEEACSRLQKEDEWLRYADKKSQEGDARGVTRGLRLAAEQRATAIEALAGCGAAIEALARLA